MWNCSLHLFPPDVPKRAVKLHPTFKPNCVIPVFCFKEWHCCITTLQVDQCKCLIYSFFSNAYSFRKQGFRIDQALTETDLPIMSL